VPKWLLWSDRPIGNVHLTAFECNRPARSRLLSKQPHVLNQMGHDAENKSSVISSQLSVRGGKPMADSRRVSPNREWRIPNPPIPPLHGAVRNSSRITRRSVSSIVGFCAPSI
jgi:hypothetical protein